MIVALLTLVAVLPAIFPASTYAQTPPPEQTEEGTTPTDHRMLAVGAGAIIGAVVFNMLTYPLGSVPFVAAPLAPTPIDIALGSRLLATMAAGATALVAHYLYEATQ
jgi:hypothetical protein